MALEHDGTSTKRPQSMKPRNGEAPLWIGVGASAGGLEALRVMVKNLPTDASAVYVIVQHMSPQHKSLLTALIGRETGLDVFEISDNMLPAVDSIYVAPPNHDVSVVAGRLRLHPPGMQPATPKPSIDRFFQSLAQSLADRAVGIVLSGTGTDGTAGVEAIRAAGGITIAQSEDTAKYFGMPESAINSGFIDVVLPPESIGRQIEKIRSMPRHLAQIGTSEEPADAFTSVMRALMEHSKVDFRDYKASTVRRRLERRVAALGLANLEAYAEHIAKTPSEVSALFKDLMISVTSFFRDPEEFEALRTQLEIYLKDRKRNGLRVWIPGCASGEEPYSIAIILAELLGGTEALERDKLQIFATDIDVDALAIARRGFYPEALIETVPDHLREKYFSRTGGGFSINGAIRDCVVFTAHNICQDPPFSNMDLVSCRNLLIYFNNDLQAKVMARLHYAVSAEGLMFLGKSETVGGADDLFSQLTPNARIFKRRVVLENRQTNLTPLLSSSPRTRRSNIPGEDDRKLGIARSMFDSLVRAVGPNCLLITDDYQIRRVYGNLDRYITLSEGDVRGVNLGMLRDSFRHEIRLLISVALRRGEPRYGAERRLESEGNKVVQVIVYPLTSVESGEDMAVVAFRETEIELSPQIADENDDPKATNAQIVVLEQELNTTRDSLQQTVEELETTNEELQALNEELQSSNEELQSTNEELETANEELQSTNEELITVNEELQINSQELSMINQELDSILANIAAPTLVIDAGLHIVRCSESARELFEIDPGVGHPHLSQCARPPGFPAMVPMVADVIRLGKREELVFDAPSMRGRITAAPYYSPKGEMIGATAIISHMGQDAPLIDHSALLDSLPAMVWQKDAENVLLALNARAAEFMGIEREDAIGRKLDELLPALAVNSAGADQSVINAGQPQTGRHELISLPNGTSRWLEVSRVPCELPEKAIGLYVIAVDISEGYQARIDRGVSKAIAETVLESAPVAIEYVGADGRLQLQNKAAEALLGHQDVGSNWDPEPSGATLLDPESGTPLDQESHPIYRALRGEFLSGDMVMRLGSDGSESAQWSNASPVHDQDGKIVGAVGTAVGMPNHRLLNGQAAAVAEQGNRPPLCVLDWNIVTDELVLSPGLTEMLDASGVVKIESFKEFCGLIHLDDRKRFDEAVDHHLNEKDVFQCVFRLVRLDEDVLWIDCRGQAVWGVDGAPTHFVATLMDVTSTWVEKREIARRTALADMAEEAGSIASWRLDLSSMRVELTDGAVKVLGLAANQTSIAFDAMLARLSKDDRSIVRHGIRNVADEAVPFSAVVRLDALDEKGGRVLLSGRAERDPGNTVIGVIGIVRPGVGSLEREITAAE